MNSNIDLWFPTVVYNNTYSRYSTERDSLISTVEDLATTIPSGGNNWYSKIVNSCGTYDLLHNSNFNNLNDWINKCLADFCQQLGCKDTYKINESWFNIYQKNDWQEAHYHSRNVFSCVFFLKAPAGSSPIVFENPLMPDMNAPDYNNKHSLNFQACKYEPIEGQLLIFRSYLKHLVPPHPLDDTRITLAYNVKG